MDFYSSIWYYISLGVLAFVAFTAWHDTKIDSKDDKPSWIIVGLFVVPFLTLLIYPSFAELNQDDYSEIKTLKEQYPELKNDILKALKDNKITIGEGVDILDKVKDIEKKLYEKRASEEKAKALKRFEEVKQELKGESR
jgi:hypothetical protein